MSDIMAPSNAVFDLQTCPLYVVDEAEPSLESIIDEQQLCMKQEVLEHVARLRDADDERAQAAAAEVEERHTAALAAKQAELDAVSQQFHAECCQHRTAQASLDRMLAAYDAIQHVRQYHMLAQRAFSGWRWHQQRRRRKEQQWQRAVAHRELLRLQGKPLMFWLHWMRVERHARAKAAMEQGLEVERAAIRRSADAQLAAMAAQMEQAQALAAHEASLRRDMEERLKFAFMRHVATLNLEAQQIIQQHPLADQQHHAAAAGSGTAQAAHDRPMGTHAARHTDQPPIKQQGARAPPASSKRPQPKACPAGEQPPGPAVRHPSASHAAGAYKPDAGSLTRPAGVCPSAALASSAASGGNSDNAQCSWPWQQHQEAEPVGRALQLPTPLSPNRGLKSGSESPDLQRSRMHAAMIFQHPQRATLIVH